MSKEAQKFALLLLISAFAFAAGGCQMRRVAAYERETLSQPKMQMPPNKVDAFLDDHIYFSKEASRGGAGGGGGGCGCN